LSERTYLKERKNKNKGADFFHKYILYIIHEVK